jgi:hypothetical protein
VHRRPQWRCPTNPCLVDRFENVFVKPRLRGKSMGNQVSGTRITGAATDIPNDFVYKAALGTCICFLCSPAMMPVHFGSRPCEPTPRSGHSNLTLSRYFQYCAQEGADCSKHRSACTMREVWWRSRQLPDLPMPMPCATTRKPCFAFARRYLPSITHTYGLHNASTLLIEPSISCDSIWLRRWRPGHRPVPF